MIHPAQTPYSNRRGVSPSRSGSAELDANEKNCHGSGFGGSWAELELAWGCRNLVQAWGRWGQSRRVARWSSSLVGIGNHGEGSSSSLELDRVRLRVRTVLALLGEVLVRVEVAGSNGSSDGRWWPAPGKKALARPSLGRGNLAIRWAGASGDGYHTCTTNFDNRRSSATNFTEFSAGWRC